MNNSATRLFIQQHLDDDVKALALKTVSGDVDLRFALQQIDGRQRAKHKLPGLAENMEIIFPVHLSVEQCSSEQTAAYKKEIIKHWLNEKGGVGQNPFPYSFADLTGGFGVDFIALSDLFAKAYYIERDSELCRIAKNNFQALKMQNAEVVNAETTPDLLRNLEVSVTAAESTGKPGNFFFFIDPARRDNVGNRTFAIADCTPNLLDLIPMMNRVGERLLVKLSPMLDWHKAVADIEQTGAKVMQVHIVSVANECKELLLAVNLAAGEQQSYGSFSRTIYCVNDKHVVQISPEEQHASVKYVEKGFSGDGKLLCLPNASIMKAGFWAFLCERYGVKKADANSHIFFMDSLTPAQESVDSTNDSTAFPGKIYRIVKSSGFSKKELRVALQDIKQANISVRNFPLTAEALRKKLKLRDGGNIYLFATTIQGEYRLFVCLKARIK